MSNIECPISKEVRIRERGGRVTTCPAKTSETNGTCDNPQRRNNEQRLTKDE
jgi:hypothetical protein